MTTPQVLTRFSNWFKESPLIGQWISWFVDMILIALYIRYSIELEYRPVQHANPSPLKWCPCHKEVAFEYLTQNRAPGMSGASSSVVYQTCSCTHKILLIVCIWNVAVSLSRWLQLVLYKGLYYVKVIPLSDHRTVHSGDSTYISENE